MSRAERFIQDYTRNCSNQSKWGVETPNKTIVYVQPWLTPDDARKAIEIAREEMMENVCRFIKEHHHNYSLCDTEDMEPEFFTEQFIQDIKQAMKDE